MIHLLDLCPALDILFVESIVCFVLDQSPLNHPSHHSSLVHSFIAKPLCRSACLRFSAACSTLISNDPVLTQLLGSTIDCEITTAADLNTLDGGVTGAGWVYDGYSILKTGSEDLYMKEYDSLGGYRCSAIDSSIEGNPFFPESTAIFFSSGLPYEVECFEPASSSACGEIQQNLECPHPFLVSDRSGCETCKMPCPSFIYETSEYRTMWAVRC